MYLNFLLTVFLWHVMPSQPSNILLLPLSGEGSHYEVMANIGKELLHRGHTVTILIGGNYEDKAKNSSEGFLYEFFKPVISEGFLHEHLKHMVDAGLQHRYILWLVKSLGSNYVHKIVQECHQTLTDTELMSRLRDSNFDLSVVDMSHKCPVVKYLRKDLEIPYVAVSAMLTIPSAACFGNRWPFNPSYMPEFTTGLPHKMTLSQRFTNTATFIFFVIIFSCFGSTPIYNDAELYLINTHFALGFARPLLPNTIPVGGLTTRPHQPLQAVGLKWKILFESGIVRDLSWTKHVSPPPNGPVRWYQHQPFFRGRDNRKVFCLGVGQKALKMLIIQAEIPQINRA